MLESIAQFIFNGLQLLKISLINCLMLFPQFPKIVTEKSREGGSISRARGLFQDGSISEFDVDLKKKKKKIVALRKKKVSN